MNNLYSKNLIIGIVIGLLASVVVYVFTAPSTHNNMDEVEQDSTPLYWVAPMDANFRRSQPGQSPMGMDLVPVFADNTHQDSPGTVKIDPVTIQNLGVKTARITKIAPVHTIKTFGKVQFSQDMVIHVHPRVKGWVEKLFVRTEGDFIEKGDALYSLYSPDLVNAQEELLIALQQNNRALINAANSRLIALKAPKSLLENIKKQRMVTRTIAFYASQSGFISKLNIQEGFYVEPSTTMLAIAPMDDVWVLADIFASDLDKIKVGQTANIETEYLPALKTPSKIDYIYPTINTLTRTATARLVVPNKDLLLKPGMYTDVTINTYSRTNMTDNLVLAVPKQSVIKTGEENRVVLALGEGKYKSINVVLGAAYDDVYEVIEGLVEGDEIVISAQFLLDSESSISSDFMRMEAAAMSDIKMEAMDMEDMSMEEPMNNKGEQP